jgi:hypothetical protein
VRDPAIIVTIGKLAAGFHEIRAAGRKWLKLIDQRGALILAR